MSRILYCFLTPRRSQHPMILGIMSIVPEAALSPDPQYTGCLHIKTFSAEAGRSLVAHNAERAADIE